MKNYISPITECTVLTICQMVCISPASVVNNSLGIGNTPLPTNSIGD